MKKINLIVILIFSLLIVGCTQDGKDNETETELETINNITETYNKELELEGFKADVKATISRTDSYFNHISVDVLFNKDNKDVGVIEKELIKSELKKIAKKEFDLTSDNIKFKTEGNIMIANMKVERGTIEEKMALDNIEFSDTLSSMYSYLEENGFIKIN